MGRSVVSLMSSNPYNDLDRPPLSEMSLRRGLQSDRLWREVSVVRESASTNAEVAAAARDGAAEGLVLIAESQTAGRGRLDRTWESPPRAGLTFSVLLRPRVPLARRTWLPLLTGLAVHAAVARLGAVPTALKWPNDLLLGDDLAKAGGILAQADGTAVVVGIGLNVTTRRDELPPGATSLAVAAAECTDRDPLLRAILRAIGGTVAGWDGTDPRPAYEPVCDTVGRDVRVQLPDGGVLTGTATGLDAGGRLLVATPDGERAVSAGDVVRVRPVPTG
jgi:BirA family transcriptional regulator, biotin operon repressor / biotin---[acetyl-CoA-carboxylase] ligase